MPNTDVSVRPRRSVLYVPGSNSRAIEKSKSLPVDGLIFDLEDSVAPSEKLAARDRVISAVRESGNRTCEVFIRVNSMDSLWGEQDLIAAVDSRADAVLLPKVGGARTVKNAVRLIESASTARPPAVWCMLETARGVLRAEEIAEEIAQSSPSKGGLVMGTNDLAVELHATQTPSRLPLITSLSLCVLAARSAGLPILDGVFADLFDIDGFEASCRQGKELGFDGKTLIHPITIEIANRVFAPTDDEVNRANKIVAAFNSAAEDGIYVTVVDGKLVEYLHVQESMRIIELSNAIRLATR